GLLCCRGYSIVNDLSAITGKGTGCWLPEKAKYHRPHEIDDSATWFHPAEQKDDNECYEGPQAHTDDDRHANRAQKLVFGHQTPEKREQSADGAPNYDDDKL